MLSAKSRRNGLPAAKGKKQPGLKTLCTWFSSGIIYFAMNDALNKKPILVILPALLIVVLIGGYISLGPVNRAQAAPAGQVPIYTPTPGPDGRIIYIVRANDTLLSISLLTGVPVDTLKGLNNLTSDTIFEGQELLLGLAGPAEVTPTSGPTPTATQVLPTPTALPGAGDLCVILFNDRNGDSMRQEEEESIPGGAISLSNRSGTVSETRETDAELEPYCFEDLPEGEYTISAAVPDGYNATTGNSQEVNLGAGDIQYLTFGAQVNSENPETELFEPPDDGGRKPLLGIIGGLFLLAGLGVAIFAGRYLRS